MNAMNLALYAQRQMSAGFKALARLLTDTPARHNAVCARVQPARGGAAPLASVARTVPSGAVSIKPLRILRVMEPGQQHTCVGRMVISGRMADVCAELDRLAAREAAMS